MPIYTYESKDGKVEERVYPIGSYPQSIRMGGRRYVLRITAPCRPVVENVAGIHHGPGHPVHIRNKHDIREIEARSNGELKYDPDFYRRRIR